MVPGDKLPVQQTSTLQTNPVISFTPVLYVETKTCRGY